MTFEIEIGNPAGDRRTIRVRLSRDEANSAIGNPLVQQAYALKGAYRAGLVPAGWQHMQGRIERVYLQ
jgi:hypothetical protein